MKLKNYNNYLQKILKLAINCNVHVIFVCDDEAVYKPARRTVHINRTCEDVSESEQLAELLHELGHFYYDMAFGFSDKEENANAALHYRKPTKKQKKIVVDFEKDAWRLGRVIAKKLKIPLGKWYDKHEKEALETYKATTTQNR